MNIRQLLQIVELGNRKNGSNEDGNRGEDPLTSLLAIYARQWFVRASKFGKNIAHKDPVTTAVEWKTGINQDMSYSLRLFVSATVVCLLGWLLPFLSQIAAIVVILIVMAAITLLSSALCRRIFRVPADTKLFLAAICFLEKSQRYCQDNSFDGLDGAFCGSEDVVLIGKFRLESDWEFPDDLATIAKRLLCAKAQKIKYLQSREKLPWKQEVIDFEIKRLKNQFSEVHENLILLLDVPSDHGFYYDHGDKGKDKK